MRESIQLWDDIQVMAGTASEESGRIERRDAAENRARLLEAAETLFAERGVADVNMADIAQAAGVGKGTLYRRFSNKADLCVALMDGQLTLFQNSMLAQLREMNARQVPKLEQLQQFLVAVVHFTEVHIPLLCEVQRGGVFGGTETTAPHFIWQHMTVTGLLRAAAAAGEISPEVDLPMTVDVLLAPLTAQFFRFLRTTRGFPPERIADGLCRLLANLPEPSGELSA